MIFFEISKSKNINQAVLQNIAKQHLITAPGFKNQFSEVSTPNFYFASVGMDSQVKQVGDRIFFIDGFIQNWSELIPKCQTDEIEVNCLIDVVQRNQEGLIKKAKGHFVAGYYDQKQKRLCFWSDEYGIKPLFYSETRESFVFSSRYQAVVANPNFEKKINWEAVEEYLSVGLILQDKTFFAYLHQLPAGAGLIIENNKSMLSKPSERTLDTTWLKMSAADVAEELYRRLKTANQVLIERFNIKEMLLTGGSDSRILLGTLSEQQRSEMTFITYESPKWSPDNWDADLACQLAKKFNLRHETGSFIEKKHKQIPMATKAYYFHHMASPTLNGSFGTELLGQGVWQALPFRYRLFRYDQFKGFRNCLFRRQDIEVNNPYQQMVAGMDRQPGPCREYQQLVPFFWRSFFAETYSPYGTHVYISPYENQNGVKLSTYLMPQVLDLVLNLPMEYLINYRMYEELFKGRLKEFAEIPFNSSIVKHVQGLKPVKKNVDTHGHSRFPYEQFFLENIDHEAFGDNFVDKDWLKSLALEYNDYHFLVRIVDYIHWYEHAVKGNRDVDAEIFQKKSSVESSKEVRG